MAIRLSSTSLAAPWVLVAVTFSSTSCVDSSAESFEPQEIAQSTQTISAIPAPKNVSARALSGIPTSILVSFDKITGSSIPIKEYRLYRFRSGGEWVATRANSKDLLNTVQIWDYMYRPDVEESYAVRAVGTDGSMGAFSPYVRVTAPRAKAPSSMKIHVRFFKMKGVSTPVYSTSHVTDLVGQLQSYISEVSRERTTLTVDIKGGWTVLPKTPAEYCRTLFVLADDPNIPAYESDGKEVIVKETGDAIVGWGTECKHSSDIKSLLKQGSPPLDIANLPSNERVMVLVAGESQSSASTKLINVSPKPLDMGSVSTMAHEFGHSLGLPEGYSVECPSDPSSSHYPFGDWLPDPGASGCTLVLYGDQSSVMGDSGHYLNYWKWMLGWIDDREIVNYPREPGRVDTVHLCSKSKSSCKRLASVEVRHGASYQLEYRNPATAEHDDVLEGVHVHLRVNADPYGFYAPCPTYFGESIGRVMSIIEPGESFTDPFRGVTFSYQSISSDEVVVRIEQ